MHLLVSLPHRFLQGETVVYGVAHRNYAPILKVLLESGKVDVDLNNAEAWFHAVKMGRPEVVECFVHHGAVNVNKLGTLGMPALFLPLSSSQPSLELFRAILSHPGTTIRQF